jgi:competence protein ComEC
VPRSGWLAIGAIVGALAVAVEERRVLMAVLGGLVLSLLAAPVLKPRMRLPLIAVSIGATAILVRAILLPSPSGLDGTPERSGPWRMVVEAIGSPREGHQVATLQTVGDDGPAFRLAATLPRYPEVEPGDVVDVEGRTRPRPDSPYGAYLERLGAWGTLDARKLELVHRPTDLATRLEHLRREAAAVLTRVLPEPEAGLAAGILIGLRERVDREVAAAFTTAGVSHVVAISGWNIAIVAAAIAAVAGSLGRRRRTVVTAIAIAGYIAFAGASPSVLRAGAMAGVVLLARESGRAGRAAAALGWAATLLLLADPTLVEDAGFQLSSLATGGLIAWATPLTERLDRWTGGRLPRWLAESLGVSLAAQAATLPVVLASFGRLALLAPLVNLLVVPLVAPAMAAGLLAMAGGALVTIGVPQAIGAVLSAPGWVALRLIIGIVDMAAAVPLASVEVAPPVGVALGIGSGTLIVALMAWRPRRRSTSRTAATVAQPATVARPANPGSTPLRLATFGLVVAVAVAGAVAITRPSGVARISVLDVGQGDAILVEGSRGGRLLVDGGPDPDRLLVQLDRRIPPWDRRIDAVILTHPHEDHVAGLALLLARYRVARVLEPGMRGPGPGYAGWLDRLAQASSPLRLTIAAGDRLTIDEIDLRVLWPIRGQVPVEPPDSGTGINNVSVVLLGTIGARRFLLAGDVEEDIDPSLLAAGLPRLDFLKVAHHGSRTATTQSFVQAVRPRIAVASAGTGNRYGHPARSTMERLAAAGARVYRTDRDGTVTISFESAGMNVQSKPRRAEVAPPEPRVPARVTAERNDGPRRSFGCAIPTVRAPTAVPPPRPLALPASPGDEAALRYHRDHAAQRPDCTVRDRPVALRLGRRRARRGAARHPVRVRPRGSVRRSAGSMGPAGRPRDGPDRRGPALRAPGDAGDVRRRDARRRGEPGPAGPPERHP